MGIADQSDDAVAVSGYFAPFAWLGRRWRSIGCVKSWIKRGCSQMRTYTSGPLSYPGPLSCHGLFYVPFKNSAGKVGMIQKKNVLPKVDVAVSCKKLRATHVGKGLCGKCQINGFAIDEFIRRGP